MEAVEAKADRISCRCQVSGFRCQEKKDREQKTDNRRWEDFECGSRNVEVGKQKVGGAIAITAIFN